MEENKNLNNEELLKHSNDTEKTDGASEEAVSEKDKKNKTREEKKALKEAKKLEKVKKLFQKKFTEKSLKRKIYKKLYIPADKEFIKDFFVLKTDEKKNKKYFEFDKSLIKDKKQLQRINAIAKEIGRQKGRVNLFAFLGAAACVFLVLFFVYIFRNFLARKIVVGGSEAAFGAKCEVSLVDFDLFNTRFRIQGYKVANKNEPMRNLFEIKNIDFYFNLLELSRGKFVAENMAIEGFTWNTQRTTSGALPPKKQKPANADKKPNPVVNLINKEVEKVKSEISVSSGLKAVQEQVDPRKILEREKAAFKIPAVKDEIMNSVNPMKEKWLTAKDEIQKHAEKTIAMAQKLAALNVQEINDVNQLNELIKVISQAVEVGKADFDLAEKLAKDVQTDIKTVERLAKNAGEAIKSDFNRIKETAAKIKSINADTGKKLIAQLINSFIIETLGKYYPYFVQGMELLKSSQKPKEPKELTLAQKSKMMERLPGTTFVFGKNSLPSFVIKNVALSGHHPEKEVFAIGGTVKAITNDADKLGLPLTINLNAAHANMKETAEGVIDLRSYSNELVDTLFTFEGFELEIPQTAEAVPSLSGILRTAGGVNVSKAHDVVITADMGIMQSALKVADFEPAFVCEIYQNILEGIKAINVKLVLTIKKGESFNIEVNTDVDNQIAQAIKKEFARQVEKIKAELIKMGENWLNEQKEIYKDEIAKFTSAANQAKKIINDIQNYEKIFDTKKAEIEKRIKDLASDKAKQLIEENIDKGVKDTVNDVLKGFF